MITTLMSADGLLLFTAVAATAILRYSEKRNDSWNECRTPLG